MTTTYRVTVTIEEVPQDRRRKATTIDQTHYLATSESEAGTIYRDLAKVLETLNHERREEILALFAKEEK